MDKAADSTTQGADDFERLSDQYLGEDFDTVAEEVQHDRLSRFTAALIATDGAYWGSRGVSVETERVDFGGDDDLDALRLRWPRVDAGDDMPVWVDGQLCAFVEITDTEVYVAVTGPPGFLTDLGRQLEAAEVAS